MPGVALFPELIIFCVLSRFFFFFFQANTELHQVEKMRNVQKGKKSSTSHMCRQNVTSWHDFILFVVVGLFVVVVLHRQVNAKTSPQENMNTVHVKCYIISQGINGKIKVWSFSCICESKITPHSILLYLYIPLFYEHVFTLYTACVGCHSTV